MHQALAVDEAVALTHADTWQAGGITGSGVKVAVIDVGFQGYAAAVPGRHPRQHGLRQSAGRPSTARPSHRSCARWRRTPQLTLICMDSEVGLGNAEQYAVANGIRIVNHSIGWYGVGRGDGSGGPGTVDGIVRDARTHGVLWVNAAGNEAAGDAWVGSLGDSNGDDLLEWSAGNPFNDVTLANGSSDCGVLRWDAWPVTSQDYDLYLINGSGDIVAGSASDQASGPGAPVEETCFTNTTGSTATFSWVVFRYSATVTPRFDFVSLAQDAGVSALQLSSSASTVGDPASSPLRSRWVRTAGSPGPGLPATATATAREARRSTGGTSRTSSRPTASPEPSTATHELWDERVRRHVRCGPARRGSGRPPPATHAEPHGRPAAGAARSAAGRWTSASGTTLCPPGKSDSSGEGALSLGVYAMASQPPLVLARDTVFYNPGGGYTTGAENLYLVNADGAGLTRIVNTDHLQKTPDARGNSVIFGDAATLATLSLLGGPVTTLASGSHLWPRLDTAGTKLTFARDGFPYEAIFTANADGSSRAADHDGGRLEPASDLLS